MLGIKCFTISTLNIYSWPNGSYIRVWLWQSGSSPRRTKIYLLFTSNVVDFLFKTNGGEIFNGFNML